MQLTKLVVAEKPSVGNEIARALGLATRGNGYFEGKGFVVTWAAGHLVELKEPSEYRPEWAWTRAFSWNELPMIPVKFELKVSTRGRAQFAIIAALMARTDVVSLVNACDAGREGELIFDYIYRAARCEKPVERLWTSAALTQAAIQREMKNLRPGAQFEGLRMAARARAAADWLVGMNGTRAVTMSQRGALYTVGRVQTPVLGFLVTREKEIQAFVPEAFVTITGVFQTPRGDAFSARYEFTPPGGARTHQIKEAAHAAAVQDALKHERFFVESLAEEKKVERPPLLYDLTSLQRDANKRFGYSAEKTLKIAQALYEKHKALTYPRSDSKHLPAEMRAELPAALDALAAAGFPAEFVGLARGRLHEKRERVFDDAKVSDHHALIPTAHVPRALGAEEERIYRLVGNRLLASFHDDFVVNVTDVVVRTGRSGHGFHAKGKVVVHAGWTSVSAPAEADRDESLPPLVKGEPLALKKHDAKQDATKPPKRHTEADLLALMENAGNKLTGESKTILKGRGIGTPATRASILQGLLRRQYAEMQGKTLAPTDLGMRLIEVLRADALKSPELTAKWELELARIESGEGSALAFSKHLKEFVAEVVHSARMGR